MIKVLLIDDDEDSFVLTRALLAETSSRQIDLEWVSSYDAGLDALRRDQHDVYLVDYRLGAGTGIKLLRRAIAEGCRAPIVMLTSQDDDAIDSEALDAGAADYLVKGDLSGSMLVRAIRYAYGRQRLLNELERSNYELDQFASVASHDLQAPLRRVVSFSELLKRKLADQLDDDAREYFDFMLDSVAQMQQLIRDLLSFSQVGTLKKPFEEVDTLVVFEQAVRNLEVAIEESGAEVTQGRLPTVLGDRSQLVQLLQNLIGNAIKYRDDRTPRVHVEADVQDDDWRFHVQDNGIGIDPEQHQRVFIMFERLHSPDRYPGSGIGLAICKKIVDRHGGRLWIEESGSEGTRFSFTIPMRAKAASSGRKPTG